MHSRGSIVRKLGPSRKASTGQTAAQLVYLQLIQGSVTTYAIDFQLFGCFCKADLNIPASADRCNILGKQILFRRALIRIKAALILDMRYTWHELIENVRYSAPVVSLLYAGHSQHHPLHGLGGVRSTLGVRYSDRHFVLMLHDIALWPAWDSLQPRPASPLYNAAPLLGRAAPAHLSRPILICFY